MNEYAKILGSALWIWKHSLAGKHKRDFKRIYKEILSEEAKTENDPANANHKYLDDLYIELRLLGDSFAEHSGSNMVAELGEIRSNISLSSRSV